MLNNKNKHTTHVFPKPTGMGFWSDGKFFLQRCYDCLRENYSPAVASGQCAWCGSTKTDKKEKKNVNNGKI